MGTAFSMLAVMAKCIEFVAKPTYGFLYRCFDLAIAISFTTL